MRSAPDNGNLYKSAEGWARFWTKRVKINQPHAAKMKHVPVFCAQREVKGEVKL